jgi:hypothetical protein
MGVLLAGLSVGSYPNACSSLSRPHIYKGVRSDRGSRYARAMIHRAPTVLLAALGTACASAAGFAEAPHTGQLAFLIAACVLAAALQTVTLKKCMQHYVGVNASPSWHVLY